MKRSLSLRREDLAELSGEELNVVVGAALPTTPVTQCAANSYVVCFTRGTTCVNCD
jgi:hypothetical protein